MIPEITKNSIRSLLQMTSRFIVIIGILFIFIDSTSVLAQKKIKEKYSFLPLKQVLNDNYLVIDNHEIINCLLRLAKAQNKLNEFESVTVEIPEHNDVRFKHYLVDEKILRKLDEMQRYYQKIIDNTSSANDYAKIQYAQGQIKKINQQFFQLIKPLKTGETIKLNLDEGTYHIVALQFNEEKLCVRDYIFDITPSAQSDATPKNLLDQEKIAFDLAIK
jgi:hypothetical protein